MAGLLVTRDTTDEVTFYILTDISFASLESLLDNVSLRQDLMLSKVNYILNDKNNIIDRIFMQTFCYEAIDWSKHNITGIIVLPDD